MKKQKNAAAQALRKLGVKKTPKARRSEIARNAVNARWSRRRSSTAA